MKTKLRWLLLMAVTLLLTGCGYAGPEKAVRQELDLIRQLDESTIKAFVSYEDIQLSDATNQEVGPETIEAVKLFFQKFKYRIRSSSLTKDETGATVEVDITNLDAEALAKDLCRSIIRSSIDYTGEEKSQKGLNSAFLLMKDCLKNNSYDTKTTTALVHLTNQNGTWIIQESPELEDALAGGLVSYLTNPYLLTPEEVLDITLEPFGDFTAEQWIRYLEMDDIFATESELAPAIDQLMAQQLADCFQYKITESAQDGDTASVVTEVTSLDLREVLAQCRTELLEYAKTTESIRATDQELSQKTAELLLAALENNQKSTVNTITISLHNNGYSWEAVLDENFTDVLLGGIENAIAVLQETEAPETESTETETT